MAQKLDRWLSCALGVFWGIWIGRSLHTISLYRTRPGLYASDSAPWYLSILLEVALTVLITASLAIIRSLIRRRLK